MGGHTWKECHRGKTNLTVACGQCSLYVRQNDKAEIFARKLAQPCAGRPMSPLPGMHPSHQLESMGFAFICVHCKRVQKIGFTNLAPVFSKPLCPHPGVQQQTLQTVATAERGCPAWAGTAGGGAGRPQFPFKKKSVGDRKTGLVQSCLHFDHGTAVGSGFGVDAPRGSSLQ